MSIIPIYTIVLACFLIIPISLGVYVYRDAERRGMNGLLWALVVIFVPSLVGLIIYLLVRGNYSDLRCPRCDAPLKDSYTVCPKCGTKLRPTCPNCSLPVEPDWKVCPKCAQPLPANQESVYSPVRGKDRSIWKILVIVILVPVLLIAVSLFAFRSFSTSGSSAFRETSFDEYIAEMRSEGDSEIADTVMDWQENLEVQANHAYALRYDHKTETETMHYFLVYVPGAGNSTKQGIGHSGSIFGTTLRLELSRTGEAGTFINVLSSSDKKMNLKVEIDGKKIPCEVTEADYNPTLFFTENVS